MFLSEWREFPSAPCLAGGGGGGGLDDSSRLDFAEIARDPDMLQSLFPSWSGLGIISTPVVYSELQPCTANVLKKVCIASTDNVSRYACICSTCGSSVVKVLC